MKQDLVLKEFGLTQAAPGYDYRSKARGEKQKRAVLITARFACVLQEMW
jgi:hypothetical protein